MEVVSTAVAAGWLLEKLGAVAISKFSGKRLETWLKERGKKQAFEQALQTALNAFSEKHADLVATFFDAAFLKGPAADEIAEFLNPTGSPSAGRLSKAWQAQFSKSIEDVEKEAGAFLSELWKAIEEHPDFYELSTQRRVVDIQSMVGDIHAVLIPPPAAIAPGPELPAASAVTAAFGIASQALLQWPQKIGDAWLERPELDELLGSIKAEISDKKSPVTVLLGDPGAGKSAILSRLGALLTERNVNLLAVKADMVPSNVSNLTEVSTWLGTPQHVAECLEALAKNGLTVLLVDQLDALCDLMDRKTDRLSALLALVHAASRIPKVKVVVSCRKFEFHHDTRLSSLHAESITLANPSWDAILPILNNYGLGSVSWPQSIQDTLRTPQHLSLFVRHLASDPTAIHFRNYQDMLGAVLDLRLRKTPNGQAAVTAAMDLAKDMAEEEELWLPLARVEGKYGEAIKALCEADILRMEAGGQRVGFAHQSLFDFLRARAFVRDSLSLGQYILERQDSLHVRPTLWSTMTYLRDIDRAAYHRDLQALWTNPDTRKHVRQMLIELISIQPTPDLEEAKILIPALDNPSIRGQALITMMNHTGWLPRLKSFIPGWMDGDDSAALQANWILGSALATEPSYVLSMIEKHWMRPERSAVAFHVLDSLTEWDARATKVLNALLGMGDIHSASVRRIMDAISKSNIELSFQVLHACLQRELDAGKRVPPPEMPPPADDAPPAELWDYTIQRLNAQPVAKILEDTNKWYELHKIAAKDCAAFVKTMWPWYAEVLDIVSTDTTLNRFRKTHHIYSVSSGSHGEGDVGDTDRLPLLHAIDVAISGWGKSDPDGFVAYFHDKTSIDSMLGQCLIARGLIASAIRAPQALLNFFLGDTRRLALGDYPDTYRMTRAIIRALMPLLSDADKARVEDYILAFRSSEPLPNEDAKTRWARAGWSREHRLRLLRAIPETARSARIGKLIKEEESAIGHQVFDREEGGATFGAIPSPMPIEKLKLATDEKILGIFERFPDQVQFDPRSMFRGSSLELARSFAKLGKENPRRAIGIMDKLQPGRHERPVGYAFSEFGDSTLEPEFILSTIWRYVTRGFDSEDFRCGVSTCLDRLAFRTNGLDDETCALMESWLTAPDLTPDPKPEKEGPEKSGKTTVLWGRSGLRIVPRGNFGLLNTLRLGYLVRKPMAADEWLAFLIRHLDRVEDIKIWQFMADELRFLEYANHATALSFFEKLVAKYPEYLMSLDGFRILAWNYRWLPREFTHRSINQVLASSWSYREQAIGELAMLLSMVRADDEHIAGLVSRAKGADATASSKFKLGVIWTAAEQWHEPAYRAACTSAIVSILPTADKETGNAAFAIFRGEKNKSFDAHFMAILEALCLNPSLLKRSVSDLIKRLQEGLREGLPAALVLKVARLIIEQNYDELADMRTRWAGDAGELVDILLTLQRFDETRLDSTGLFEVLMEAGIYDMKRSLRELDRRI